MNVADVTSPADEQVSALANTAKVAILYRCRMEVKTQRNYLKGTYETVRYFVAGKWRLKRDTLDLMKRLTPASSTGPRFEFYSVFEDAFENALREVLREGLVIEDREYPMRTKMRRNFAITTAGLEFLQSSSELVRILEEEAEL